MLRDPKSTQETIQIIMEHPQQVTFFLDRDYKRAGIGLQDWRFALIIEEDKDGKLTYDSVETEPGVTGSILNYPTDKASFTNFIEVRKFTKCLTQTNDFFLALVGERRTFLQCSKQDMEFTMYAYQAAIDKLKLQIASTTDQLLLDSYKKQISAYETLYNRAKYQFNQSF